MTDPQNSSSPISFDIAKIIENTQKLIEELQVSDDTLDRIAGESAEQVKNKFLNYIRQNLQSKFVDLLFKMAKEMPSLIAVTAAGAAIYSLKSSKMDKGILSKIENEDLSLKELVTLDDFKIKSIEFAGVKTKIFFHIVIKFTYPAKDNSEPDTFDFPHDFACEINTPKIKSPENIVKKVNGALTLINLTGTIKKELLDINQAIFILKRNPPKKIVRNLALIEILQSVTDLTVVGLAVNGVTASTISGAVIGGVGGTALPGVGNLLGGVIGGIVGGTLGLISVVAIKKLLKKFILAIPLMLFEVMKISEGYYEFLDKKGYGIDDSTSADDRAIKDYNNAEKAITPIANDPSVAIGDDTDRTYTIKTGDTLWDIAKMNVGGDANKINNYIGKVMQNPKNHNIIDPNLIYAGDQIYLPLQNR